MEFGCDIRKSTFRTGYRDNWQIVIELRPRGIKFDDGTVDVLCNKCCSLIRKVVNIAISDSIQELIQEELF